MIKKILFIVLLAVNAFNVWGTIKPYIIKYRLVMPSEPLWTRSTAVYSLDNSITMQLPENSSISAKDFLEKFKTELQLQKNKIITYDTSKNEIYSSGQNANHPKYVENIPDVSTLSKFAKNDTITIQIPVLDVQDIAQETPQTPLFMLEEKAYPQPGSSQVSECASFLTDWKTHLESQKEEVVLEFKDYPDAGLAVYSFDGFGRKFPDHLKVRAKQFIVVANSSNYGHRNDRFRMIIKITPEIESILAIQAVKEKEEKLKEKINQIVNNFIEGNLQQLVINNRIHPDMFFTNFVKGDTYDAKARKMINLKIKQPFICKEFLEQFTAGFRLLVKY